MLRPDLGVGRSVVAARSVGWLLSQTLVSRGIGFLAQLVLARLLAPSDYGEIGLTYTIIAVVSTLAGFGIDEVLVQRRGALRYWAYPATVLTLVLSLGVFAIVNALAPLGERLYRTERLSELILMASLSMPLNAFCVVPAAMLRHQLRFQAIAVLGVLDLLASSLLTVFFAWRGFGPFSFVLPTLIVSVFRAAALWWLAPVPLFNPGFRHWRLLLDRGGWVFGHRALTAVVGQADYFILGILTSPTVVGVYYFAFRLAVQPISLLAGNLSNVLMPMFRQLGGSEQSQREAAVRVMRLLNLTILPAGALIAAVADPLVPLAFGEKWRDAAPIIAVLTMGISFDAAAWIAGSLMSARGEFRRILFYTLAAAPVFFIAVPLGAVTAGGLGAAWGVSLYYFVAGPLFTWASLRPYGVSAVRVGRLYVVPVFAAAASGLICFAVLKAPFPPDHPALKIVVGLTAGVAAYALVLLVFAPDAVRWGRSLVLNLASSRRARGV